MLRRLEEFYAWLAANPDSTEREIASGVGLKKTPYSHQLLIQMLNMGWITCRVDEDGRRPTNRYSVIGVDEIQGRELGR